MAFIFKFHTAYLSHRETASSMRPPQDDDGAIVKKQQRQYISGTDLQKDQVGLLSAF